MLNLAASYVGGEVNDLGIGTDLKTPSIFVDFRRKKVSNQHFILDLKQSLAENKVDIMCKVKIELG